jgi:SAM-dependent methyltransferase
LTWDRVSRAPFARCRIGVPALLRPDLQIVAAKDGDVAASTPVVAQTSFDALVTEAEALPVDGWDLSALGDRISIAPMPWDFDETVTRHAHATADLLDIGTGGGEWLASLAHRPARTVATEGWPPNVDVAGRRLRPLAVTVVATEPAPDNVDQVPDESRGRLPFPSDSFALVTSRHESFVASEIARVLVPEGTFLTEQVGGDYGDFYEALELARPPVLRRRWTLPLAEEQLASAGLRIVDSGEGTEVTSFSDVGTLAWYLKLSPWTVENFSIETHRSQLERLHRRIAVDGPLRVRLPAFWLNAVKPS